MKIYTQKFRCAKCRKVIGEYSEKNKERTIKSWVSVCYTCFKTMEKQIARIKEMDLRIKKLEKSLTPKK